MSWEKRGAGSTRYYTRTRRVNGRHVREYLGSGPLAQVLADLDRLDREARELAAQEWAEFLAEQAKLEQAMDEKLREAQALAEATLTAAGYHKHKRQWRKRKHDGSPEPSTAPNPEAE